ncbi:MAG: 50S ribosomal protein L10 [Bacteroidia bacterium]|nr:50S ribosomal protein L10 [Bacteroidia bacterium]
MTREDKSQIIENLVGKFNEFPNFYVADISYLDASNSNDLRRLCYKRGVQMQIVKNTLIRKALEKLDGDYDEVYDVLKGNSAIMMSETTNLPAKVIKEFRKKSDRPILKAAWIDTAIYIGDDKVEELSALKSKEELIGEVISLLQSPAKNVISSLQSGGQTLSGILKTLEDRDPNAS